MQKRRNGFFSKKNVAILLGGLLGFVVAGVCQAASSCVTCHTDAGMLEDNLAPAKAVSSAMQSGAG